MISRHSLRSAASAAIAPLTASWLVQSCNSAPAPTSEFLTEPASSAASAPPAPAAPPPQRGSVRGSLHADLGTAGRIALPGLRVSLGRADKGSAAISAITDQDGIFELPDVAPGAHQLCWEGTGWLSECAGKPVVVAGDVGLGAMRVQPDLRPDPEGRAKRVVWGTVRLADGAIPGARDAFIGLADVPSVSLPGLSRTVPIDAAGRFVAAGVPAGGAPLEVRLGKDAIREVLPEDKASIELRSKSHEPRIQSLDVLLAGRRVDWAPPGAKVTVRARVRDTDGDTLSYRWKPASADGAVSGESSAVEWTLPTAPGKHTLHLVVEDGRGGYAFGEAAVFVSKTPVTGASPACRRVELCPGCPTWEGYPKSRFLTRFESTSPDDPTTYYEHVDPRRERATLGAWWVKNGFDAEGKGGIRASYLNHADLGFGRDMHCTAHGPENKWVACYVTNYGCNDQESKNANLARDAIPETAGATVTMEYAPIEDGGEPVVKFFAYGGGVGGAGRVLAVDLDGFGPKNIPHVCGNCHGGSARRHFKDASFREFDLAALRYTNGRADYRVLLPDELKTFRELNELVLKTLPPASFIRQNIEGWYPSPDDDMPDYTWVPRGWEQEKPKALYHGIVAPHCRTCHIALQRFLWRSFNDFAGSHDTIEQRTCRDGQRVMPHSVITYNNFWKSDAPRILAAFEHGDWKPRFGTCPKP